MSNESDLKDKVYREELNAAIDGAIAEGASTLEDIGTRCRGAGLEVVNQILVERGLDDAKLKALARDALESAALARRRASLVLSRLPVPDPERAQWWFTLDGIERMAALLARLARGRRVGLLGMPTVAAYYATRYQSSVDLMDIDPDAIAAASVDCSLPGTSVEVTVRGHQYSVRDPKLPLDAKFAVIAIDPPWYAMEMAYFAARTESMVENKGFVVATMPGVLTRPGIHDERDEIASGPFRRFDLKSVHQELVSYQVPVFEGAAHERFAGFSGRSWRHGDVLVFQRNELTTEAVPLPAWDEPEIETFSKNPRELRLFLAPSRAAPELFQPIVRVPEYSKSVSRRDTLRREVALWSSSKIGFKVRDASTTRRALQIWATAKSAKDAREQTKEAELLHILDQLYTELQLPADTRDTRRTPAELVELNARVLSVWATPPSPRAKPEDDDGYRLPHARDRDRVLWSDGLKRLAHKTQVFSLENSDYVRQRLAHSIEVMQLATTIGTSFGLDRDLIEAGALAHDIGHTPFGHAGEHALDAVLNSINPSLGGFNHYEHGVDVIRWLEDPYRSRASGSIYGLNLTRGVCECVFKHTFCMTGHRISQAELWGRSKYKENWPELVGADACHLEGQAVRIADKISYLISDLEDGLRLGALRLQDLKACRLFQHAPLDLDRFEDESEIERYVSQRRALIQFLMEDVINATAKRLSQISPESIRASNRYTVDHSEDVAEEVSEVWHRLQGGLLHRDPRVVSANLQAARIVSSLFMIFAIEPALVDRDFARSHRQLGETSYMKWYRSRSIQGREMPYMNIPSRLVTGLALESAIGVERQKKEAHRGAPGDEWQVHTDDIVMAKDYVASLSDDRAQRLFRKLLNQA